MVDGTVIKLVEDLRLAGVELSLGKDGGLQIRGKGSPPAALMDALKARKDEVVAFLLDPSPCDPCDADQDHADQDQDDLGNLDQDQDQDDQADLDQDQADHADQDQDDLGQDANLIKPDVEDADQEQADPGQGETPYRRACSWILPRLHDLKAEGWTVKGLFKRSTMGLAWRSELWSKAEGVELYRKGAVGFEMPGPSGGHVICVRPST